MSVGWDVKWCPVSSITTPLARKRQFHWISIKTNYVRAASWETSKCQYCPHLTNRRRCYMAEILLIRRKTLSSQTLPNNICKFDLYGICFPILVFDYLKPFLEGFLCLKLGHFLGGWDLPLITILIRNVFL